MSNLAQLEKEFGIQLTLTNEYVEYVSGGYVDGDGPGPSYGDSTHQNQTAYRYKGKSIRSDLVRASVVPECLVEALPGTFLGCLVEITYKGKTTENLCYDLSRPPRASRWGEMSMAAAKALGIPNSPVSGGVSFGVKYRFYFNRSAVIDGVTYPLQKL